MAVVESIEGRLLDAVLRHLDRQSQRLDLATSRMGRPSSLAHRQRMLLASAQQRLRHSVHLSLQSRRLALDRAEQDVQSTLQRAFQRAADRCERADVRLGLLDPTLVLKRGYAWLTLENGSTLTSVAQTKSGQSVRATLTDGAVDLTVAN